MMSAVISSQSQLDPKDHPLLDMFDWCYRQGDIVVMQSGLVLTSHLHSRSVPNCKVMMQQRGLVPSKVLQASQNVIDILLADAEASLAITTAQTDSLVSAQQQRLRSLVKEALHAEASDIHLEVRPEITRIRFRKHGDLYLHAEWQSRLGKEIASVAFNKETDHAITHFNPSVPQNASMPLEIDGKSVRLRLASMPAHGGFDVVMRVLATGEEKVGTLADLGYLPEQIAIIERAIAMPHGAVIISGPTGSGKTTTLASCMSLVETHRKIYTIEDPVEKIVARATQIPVNTEKDDRDYASMSKATLRMDPDVIVIGEIRDEETASVMLRAAITGHLVFSTLHTNTATATVTRLIDMGISPLMLGDPNVLVALICQRLVPVLCKHCALPFTEKTAPQALWQRWSQLFNEENRDQLKMRGQDKHCQYCEGHGVGGRTVIAEALWIDETARVFIQQRDMLGWEKHLREQGYQGYQAHALALVREGRISPVDVEKLTGYVANISV